jgi:hypothetical protein
MFCSRSADEVLSVHADHPVSKVRTAGTARDASERAKRTPTGTTVRIARDAPYAATR